MDDETLDSEIVNHVRENPYRIGAAARWFDETYSPERPPADRLKRAVRDLLRAGGKSRTPLTGELAARVLLVVLRIDELDDPTTCIGDRAAWSALCRQALAVDEKRAFGEAGWAGRELARGMQANAERTLRPMRDGPPAIPHEFFQDEARRFAKAILRDPSTYLNAAKWLTPKRKKPTRKHPTPWALHCAGCVNELLDLAYHTGPAFANFHDEHCRRVALVTALLFDADFDARTVGLNWEWEPAGAGPGTDCRKWARGVAGMAIAAPYIIAATPTVDPPPTETWDRMIRRAIERLNFGDADDRVPARREEDSVLQGDPLWAALQRRIDAVESEDESKPTLRAHLGDPQRPTHRDNINHLAIKCRLADRPVLTVEEEKDDQGSIWRVWLVVQHPGAADPLGIIVWTKGSAASIPKFDPRKVREFVSYLRAWQAKRAAQLATGVKAGEEPAKASVAIEWKPDVLGIAILREVQESPFRLTREKLQLRLTKDAKTIRDRVKALIEHSYLGETQDAPTGLVITEKGRHALPKLSP